MKPSHIDDVRAAIKNGIWCSSKNGNKILEQAWALHKPGEMILLLFSVTRRYNLFFEVEIPPLTSLKLSILWPR